MTARPARSEHRRCCSSNHTSPSSAASFPTCCWTSPRCSTASARPAFKIGAIPVNANYRYTTDELSSLLDDADSTAVVFRGELAGNVAHAATNVPTLKLLVRVGDAPDNEPGPEAPDYGQLLATTDPRPNTPRPGSDQLFMYTGGTTGKPKGVIWQHADLLHSLAVPIFRRSASPGSPAGWTR